MKVRPTVFVGSSTEGLPIAQALQVLLDHQCEVEIWSQGVFGLSQGGLESLVLALDRFDFAVLVLSADDLIMNRGETVAAPRDNVLFELGLFTGGLGRARTYMLYERIKPPKLPTDLAGITAATFEQHSSGNLEAALGAAATKIKQQIQRLGLRDRRGTSTDIADPGAAETQYAKLPRPWVIIDAYSARLVEDEETGEEDLWESVRIVNRGGAPAVSIVIPRIRFAGRSAHLHSPLPTLGPSEAIVAELSGLRTTLDRGYRKMPAPSKGSKTLLLPWVIEYRGLDCDHWTTEHAISFDGWSTRVIPIVDPSEPQQWTNLSFLEQ